MTLSPIARTTHRPVQTTPSLAALHVEPIYARWAEQLLGDAGYHLIEPDPFEPAHPAFVFDGAGDQALRALLERTWAQNTRTIVYTLHAHPIWHAALASTGAHVATWPASVPGIALAAARAAQGDVRTLPPAPIKGTPARVAALMLTGMSGIAAADRLGMSVKTLNSHLHQIMGHCSATAPGGNRRPAALLEITNAYYTGGEA